MWQLCKSGIVALAKGVVAVFSLAVAVASLIAATSPASLRAAWQSWLHDDWSPPQRPDAAPGEKAVVALAAGSQSARDVPFSNGQKIAAKTPPPQRIKPVREPDETQKTAALTRRPAPVEETAPAARVTPRNPIVIRGADDRIRSALADRLSEKAQSQYGGDWPQKWFYDASFKTAIGNNMSGFIRKAEYEVTIAQYSVDNPLTPSRLYQGVGYAGSRQNSGETDDYLKAQAMQQAWTMALQK